jgi:transcriptional regulator with XRE-family HTH domain
MSSIGDKIKKVREIKSFTQSYMADRLGMSLAGYGKIERDETDIPYSRLEQISTVLNMKVEDLISFDEKTVFNIMYNKIAKDLNVNHFNNDNTELYEKHIKLLEEKVSLLESKK